MTSNYDLKPLTQVCEVLSGGTPKTTVPEFWNGNIPWASVKDFNIDSRWFSKTEKSISQLGLDSCSSVLLEPGDLVISARGTVGVVGQCKMRTSFNQSNYGLRAKSALSKNDYLYYALSYAKRALIGDTHGGMFDTITRDTLDRLLIPIPTLKAQEKIAEILGSLDMKIAVNNALSKTLEIIAQTIFKSWFIDFDPVKAKMAGKKPVGMDAATAALFPDSLEESELGLIPKGWKVNLLGELITPKKGKTITKATCVDGEVPVVAGGLQPAYFHNKANVSQPAITVSASGANAGFVRLYLKDIWASDCSYINYEITQTVHFWYLYLLRNQEVIYGMQQGAAQPHIYPSDLMRLRLSYPSSIDSVLKFEETVAPLFLEIGVLERQNELLRIQRDSLLPRLISGELQIPEEMLAS